MTHDLPIPRQDDRSDSTSVIEWGTQAEETSGPQRWRSAFGGFGRDHRLLLLLAGLGAVAALASLIGEWATITLPTSSSDGSDPLQVASNVSEVGNLGVGYLVGMLMLSTLVALALRGTVAVRANARVAGLALAVGLLAVLVATAVSLQDGGRRTMIYSAEDVFEVEFGRGLVMAFAAVLLFAAALGRANSGSDAAATESGRRKPRPRQQIDDEDQHDDRGPIDITVAPTVPFAREARPD